MLQSFWLSHSGRANVNMRCARSGPTTRTFSRLRGFLGLTHFCQLSSVVLDNSVAFAADHYRFPSSLSRVVLDVILRKVSLPSAAWAFSPAYSQLLGTAMRDENCSFRKHIRPLAFELDDGVLGYKNALGNRPLDGTVG